MSPFGAEKNLFHMPIKTHEDPIFKEKRKPKNPIKFRISLNEEQKRAKEIILNSKVAILAGKAGSGKTLLACQIALDGLFTKQYEKIIITRPTVSKEEIGFLPGDLHQKWTPGYSPSTRTCTSCMVRSECNLTLRRVTLRSCHSAS